MKTPAEYLANFFSGIFDVLFAAGKKLAQFGYRAYQKASKKHTEMIDGKKVPRLVADEMAVDDMDVSRKEFGKWTKQQQENYRAEWKSLSETEKSSRRADFELTAEPRIKKAMAEYEKAAKTDPSKITKADREKWTAVVGDDGQKMAVSNGDWKRWTKQQQEAYKLSWSRMPEADRKQYLEDFEKDRQAKLAGKLYYYADAYSPSAKKKIEEERKKLSEHERQKNEISDNKNDGKKNTGEKVSEEQKEKERTSTFAGKRHDNSSISHSINSYASNEKAKGKYTNLEPQHAAEIKSQAPSNEKVNGKYTNLAPQHAVEMNSKAPSNEKVNGKYTNLAPQRAAEIKSQAPSNEKVNGRYTNLAPQKAQNEVFKSEEQREAFKEKVKKGAQERKQEATASRKAESLSLNKEEKAALKQ